MEPGDAWPWLAGLFDRAGRIQLGSRRPVLLSVHDTHADTLALIQQHLRAGELLMRTAKRGGLLFVWRVRDRNEVWRVLTTMLPYLTTSRESAYQAMDRIRASEAKEQDAQRIDREIQARWMTGEPEYRIAAALGVSPTRVIAAIAKHQRGPSVP
jgi:hypothetical protein